MPVSLDFLRGVLGVLTIVFGFMAGRAAAIVRNGGKPSRLYAWLIRTILCGAVVVFRRQIDVTAIAVWTFAVAAFGTGFWEAGRSRKSEDMSREIFPHVE